MEALSQKKGYTAGAGSQRLKPNRKEKKKKTKATCKFATGARRTLWQHAARAAAIIPLWPCNPHSEHTLHSLHCPAAGPVRLPYFL